MVYTTIVSTALVAEHLDRWAVVDCRFDLQNEDWGRDQYRTAHVPGAVYASLSEDLAGERTGDNGRHPLPGVEALAATFGRLGIDRRTQVAVYDQDGSLFASRFWWLMKYLGHDAVALMDGGWAKWLREGRSTRRGEESRPATVFTPDPRPHMRVTIDDVRPRVGRRDTLLVDARGPERFEGRTEPLDRAAGHIPGAVNHYYRWNVAADGTMLPAETLRERFTALLGGRAPEEVVVYCGSGVSACHNVLAMEHAGLGAPRLYAGSWSEWSSDPSRPVETGAGHPGRPTRSL